MATASRTKCSVTTWVASFPLAADAACCVHHERSTQPLQPTAIDRTVAIASKVVGLDFSNEWSVIAIEIHSSRALFIRSCRVKEAVTPFPQTASTGAAR